MARKSAPKPDSTSAATTHPAVPAATPSLAQADLMFVGGPGGPLLDKMIEAMGAKPGQVYISNSFPTPIETAAAIRAVKPKVVVALGVAAGMGMKRGKIHAFEGTKFISTFHPQELLQNPAAKKDCWEDLKVAMKELGWQSKTAK